MDWVANFTALPVWAQALAIITFAASAAVFVVVTKLGISAGSSGKSEVTAPTATVAAVIVDPSALNRLTAAGEALNMTLMERNAIGREAAKVHAEDVKVMSEFADEMARLREEIRIHREVNRR